MHGQAPGQRAPGTLRVHADGRRPRIDGVGAGRLPVRVHARDRWDTASRFSPLSTEEARRALAKGIPGCPQCRPHITLGVRWPDRGPGGRKAASLGCRVKNPARSLSPILRPPASGGGGPAAAPPPPPRTRETPTTPRKKKTKKKPHNT
ncbi:DUF6233 domain-containing protein, partial [Streptomyces sp. NPDC059411]|uniref:DUF6233 domain-containing protein n=1 Tax=Streptomyces sp. NPDC059411 TaxID=3346825 RepID=UPI003674A9FE